jgi:lipoate-protein ligase A
MKTETLKINITQRILNINDKKILSKIAKLLDEENIVGYDADGNPISEKQYAKDIHEALHQLSEEKLEAYSSEEVRKKILG